MTDPLNTIPDDELKSWLSNQTTFKVLRWLRYRGNELRDHALASAESPARETYAVVYANRRMGVLELPSAVAEQCKKRGIPMPEVTE